MRNPSHPLLALAAILVAGCAHQAPQPVAYRPDAPMVHRDADGVAADAARALITDIARRATADLGRPNGYERYDDTRLPLPKAAEATASLMRAAGYGGLVDQLMMDINRSVELAARQAMPMLDGAIAQLEIRDPAAVLDGNTSAATDLLCAQRDALVRDYATVLNAALAEAGYYRSLEILIRNYNEIPVLADTTGFAVEPELREHGIDGICRRMTVEEARLREARAIKPVDAGGATAAVVAATTPGLDRKLTAAERNAMQAVRETLVVATGRAVNTLAKPGGYRKNDATRITLPSTLAPVATALRAAGLGQYVDEVEVDMNVAAEIAAPRAAPLLQSAAQTLAVGDATIILQGDNTAATRVFRTQTEGQLLVDFRAAIDDGLRRTGFVDSYRAMLDQYGALPGATRPTLDPAPHVLVRAVDGIYSQVGWEETRIRVEPDKRDSKVLQRAFGGDR